MCLRVGYEPTTSYLLVHSCSPIMYVFTYIFFQCFCIFAFTCKVCLHSDLRFEYTLTWALFMFLPGDIQISLHCM